MDWHNWFRNETEEHPHTAAHSKALTPLSSGYSMRLHPPDFLPLKSFG